MPGEELLTADLGRIGVDSRARGGRGGVGGGAEVAHLNSFQI